MTLENLIAGVPDTIRTLIKTTIPTLDGWCSEEKALALAGLVLQVKPATSIELGVWAGRSLLPMAWAARLLTPPGNVIGVDAWSAASSIVDESPENVKFWSDQKMHDDIHEKAKWIIARFKLNDIVTLVKSRTDDFHPMTSGLLHIDGSHTDQALKDAERFGPHVVSGGVVVCDDLLWTGGSVLRAVDALEQMGFVEQFRRSEGGEHWNVMQRT